MRRAKREALVLALDIGSSSVRTAFFDERAQRIPQSAASRDYKVTYGADGGAELNAANLLRAVKMCLRQTRRACRGAPIVAVSGSGFWHGLLGLDRRRRPITSIYMWADSRSVTDAERLRAHFDERAIHKRTGCMLRASFWPAKLAWLRRTDGKLFRRAAFWVSPAEWIFEEIFEARGCSLSTASATGLFDQRGRRWDEKLCEALGVDTKKLSSISEVGGLFRGLGTVFTAVGDGAASNLGSGADRERAIAINIGTSAAVRAWTHRADPAVPFGLFRYAVDQDRAVIGGAISNAGNLRRWCLRELRVTDDARPFRRTDRAKAAESILDVLPFWVAERAPTWPEYVRGAITGFTQTTTAPEIEQSAMCATFYRLAQILELTETATGRAREIIVSGGILRSAHLLPLLADALGRDVGICIEQEASIRGAALYALQKLGMQSPPLRTGALVKHDRRLAGKHRERRERQENLERRFSRLR